MLNIYYILFEKTPTPSPLRPQATVFWPARGLDIAAQKVARGITTTITKINKWLTFDNLFQFMFYPKLATWSRWWARRTVCTRPCCCTTYTTGRPVLYYLFFWLTSTVLPILLVDQYCTTCTTGWPVLYYLFFWLTRIVLPILLDDHYCTSCTTEYWMTITVLPVLLVDQYCTTCTTGWPVPYYLYYFLTSTVLI